VTVLLREGTALFDRGKFMEAREVLEEVLTVQPAQPDATRILEQANDKLEQREQIEKLLAEGEISLKHGKIELAAAAYRRVLTMDPENRDAQRGVKRAEKSKSGLPTSGHITPRPVPALRPERKPSGSSSASSLSDASSFAVILFLPKHGAAPLSDVAAGAGNDSAEPAAVTRNDSPGEKKGAGSPVPLSPGKAHEGASGAAPAVDMKSLKEMVSSAREEMLGEKKKTGGGLRRVRSSTKL